MVVKSEPCAMGSLGCIKEPRTDSTNAASFSRPPCFLVTNIKESSNWMPIPKDFVEAHTETAMCGNARLQTANGEEWSVEVGGPGKLLGFTRGWKNFVASTSVNRGDQMLFMLVSKNCFFVYVFNKLGVEVTPSLSSAPKYTALANGKRQRQETVKSEPVLDESNSGSSDDSEYKASKSDLESPSDSDSDTEMVSPEFNDKKIGDGKILPRATRGPKRKFTGPKKIENTKPSQKKKVVATPRAKDSMLYEPGSLTTTYKSLRRDVTEAELNRTMSAAQSFKTKNPSIPVLMKPSHVYRGFWLTIPGAFSKEFLPQYKTEIILQDIHGFEWPATWIRSDHHTGVSGGWAAFSKDHCLEEGDMCVFEVIDSKDWKVLVHIFRVVKVKLVPGTRGGWEKTYNIVHGALMNKSGITKSKKSSDVFCKKRGPYKKKDEASLSDESDGADDVPLAKLYKEKRSDCNLDSIEEKIDVKPDISKIGSTVKLEHVPGTVKVKQEVGVPEMCKAKLENHVYCEDVKPTPEQLRSSLHVSAVPRDPICDIIRNTEGVNVRSPYAIVKPEPVEIEALKNEVKRTWYPVVKVLGKRQNQKSPDSHDLLVSLVGCVVRSSETDPTCEDGNGNWWVPSKHFSSDFATCYVD